MKPELKLALAFNCLDCNHELLHAIDKLENENVVLCPICHKKHIMEVDDDTKQNHIDVNNKFNELKIKR